VANAARFGHTSPPLCRDIREAAKQVHLSQIRILWRTDVPRDELRRYQDPLPVGM